MGGNLFLKNEPSAWLLFHVKESRSEFSPNLSRIFFFFHNKKWTEKVSQPVGRICQITPFLIFSHLFFLFSCCCFFLPTYLQIYSWSISCNLILNRVPSCHPEKQPVLHWIVWPAEMCDHWVTNIYIYTQHNLLRLLLLDLLFKVSCHNTRECKSFIIF